MKRLTREEIQQCSLAVLRQVRHVCDEHGLHYSLTGGTLLGAVRHQGFIPWDDDIDIMLPRPDYDRLCQIAGESDCGFRLLAGENSPYPFAKACHPGTRLLEQGIREGRIPMGVYVDVFPVDGMGSGLWTARIRTGVFQILHGLKITCAWKTYHPSCLGRHRFAPLRLGCFAVSRVLGRERIDRWVDRFLRRRDYGLSRYAGRMVGDYGLREIFPKSVFDDCVQLTFEGERFSAVSQYDAYLTGLYGDYRVLPPADKRDSHHSFEAYWVET